MTDPSKLVEKAIRRLNAIWNSVNQRDMAWSLCRSCGYGCGRLRIVLVHYAHARVTARDSIGHVNVKRAFFGRFVVIFMVDQLVEHLPFMQELWVLTSSWSLFFSFFFLSDNSLISFLF